MYASTWIEIHEKKMWWWWLHDGYSTVRHACQHVPVGQNIINVAEAERLLGSAVFFSNFYCMENTCMEIHKGISFSRSNLARMRSWVLECGGRLLPSATVWRCFSNADATRGLKQYETPMTIGIYKQSPLSHDNQRILGSLKLLVKKKPLKRERKKNTHTPYPNHYSAAAAPPPSPPPLFSAGLWSSLKRLEPGSLGSKLRAMDFPHTRGHTHSRYLTKGLGWL